MPDSSDRQPTITVTGSGSVDADPDRVELHLLLVAEDQDRQRAFQQVAARSQRLASLLDSLHIPGNRRHTTGIDLQEITRPEQKAPTYLAQAGLSVRLEPEGPLTVLLARAVKEVGASVRGLNWYLSSGHPARLEAVRRASFEARSRAQAAAEALSLSVAAVVEIRLMGSPTSRPRHLAMASAGLLPARRAAEPEVEPGQISAIAEIEVTFRLEPNIGSGGNS